MATPPLTSPRHLAREGTVAIHVPWRAVCSTGLGIAGVFSIWSTVLYLEDLWRTDPLKSIGALVPPISLLLILRVWRALDWETRGSWWGLAVLLPIVALVRWRDHGVLELVLSPSWTIFLPPHSLVAFGYVSGVVLLFGGGLLYRAALFPILLMWLVNPVPHVFSRLVDLPLQHISAATARGFAHLLGQHLSPSQLALMFTPSFGMFIAPGCDGIRGSVTMGFLALVAGYLYRFRLRLWVSFVVAAVLLGYAFNLLRLCALVLYYIVALRLPWLQSRAESGDYLIGAVLFFIATVLLFTAIGRFSFTHDLRLPTSVAFMGSVDEPRRDDFWLRWAAFALLAVAGASAYARHFTHAAVEPRDEAVFPARVGQFALRRTWQERLAGGGTLFDWAEYATPGARTAIAVGISPFLGAHDTLVCHAARGDDWLWHSALTLSSAMGPVSFSAALYNDGASQTMEASTLCSGQTCGEWTGAGRHLGFVYSRPRADVVLGQSTSRPIPILLKAETPDAGLDPKLAVALLQKQLGDFLSGASLAELTAPYRMR